MEYWSSCSLFLVHIGLNPHVFRVWFPFLQWLIAAYIAAHAMDDDSPLSIWQLEMPSILGVAAHGSEVLDDLESVSVDWDYDSSVEAQYEREAIAEDEDLEILMACSKSSCNSVVSVSGCSLSEPLCPPPIQYNTLLPDNVDLGCFQPRSFLESEAKKSLLRGLIDGALVAGLMDELPTSFRGIHGGDNFGSLLSPRVFNAGAFTHGPHAGLHLCTLAHELPVLALVSLVRGARPDLYFSTVSLLRNARAVMHRDCHNHARTVNFAIPLTQFSGGEIFVEDAAGDSQMGQFRVTGKAMPLLKDFEPSPVEFNPRLWHCTLLWGGERVILVACHIRNPDRLPRLAAEQLRNIGFRIRLR